MAKQAMNRRSRQPAAPTPEKQDDAQRQEPPLWRKLSAELLGAFMLTLVVVGGAVIDTLTHGAIGHVAKAAAPGLVVMALIYAVGEVSGAHFNPAVTLGFALHRAFAWRLVPAYWLAQFAGAMLAGLVARAIFGSVVAAGTPHPDTTLFSVGQALAMEVVLTWLLVGVILGTAEQARITGPNAALAVGGTIGLCGLFAGPVSGAVMNPAVGLGPALSLWSWHASWIYLLGPAIGAVLAVGCALIIHGPPRAHEEHTAQGGGS